jgi:8-oxo-dGTP pyrophosphatase MutT (NUDIX family)
MRLSGDGFVRLADGSVRWGLYGAAGVLVRHVDPDADGDDPHYFLARRSMHTHLGGTWAIPGGALDQGETPLEGALREFVEEIGVALDEASFEVAQVHEDDHGGWSYWTLVVDVPHRFDPPDTLTWETAEVRWVRRSELDALELFGAFRTTLDRLGLS